MKRIIAVSIITIFIASCGNYENRTSDTEAANNTVPAYDLGKDLFVQNCTQCHKINDNMIGPALKGAMKRWDDDTVAIRSFIKNSSQLIKDGNARAIEVYHKWNKSLMTPMPHLTNEDIDAILDYIEREG